jgi:hypothetical protein
MKGDGDAIGVLPKLERINPTHPIISELHSCIAMLPKSSLCDVAPFQQIHIAAAVLGGTCVQVSTVLVADLCLRLRGCGDLIAYQSISAITIIIRVHILIVSRLNAGFICHLNIHVGDSIDTLLLACIGSNAHISHGILDP